MLKDTVDMVTAKAKGIFKQVAPAVLDIITPQPIKEIRKKADHIAKLEGAEEFLTEIRQVVDNTIEEELKFNEENKAMRKKRKKKLKREKAGDELQTNEKEDAHKAVLQASFDDFRDRHRKIVEAEQEAKQREEQEEMERLERDTQALRLWRQGHWGEQAKKLYKEADTLKAANLRARERAVEASVEETTNDWHDREKARIRMQVEAPALSEPSMLPSRSLGIFGTPQDPGSYFAFKDGGFVPGLDHYDFPLFDVNPQTDFESDNINLIDKTAELSRNQALYDNLQSYAKRLDKSMDQMCQFRSDAERDLKQVTNELLVMEKEQLGPPRRLPLPSEVSNINLRKEKVNILKSHISDLQHSIDVSHERKLNVDAQMLSLAKTLAVLRQETKEMDSDLTGVNNGLGMLPVVIGRNITKVDGLDVTAKPLETYNAVTQQSKFVLYKDMEKTAQKAHRDGIKLDRKMWIMKQTDTETRDDVERALNKLADISDRLHQAHISSIKENLIDAIQGFFRSGIKLHPVKERYSGPLRWWMDHKSAMSTNVEGCHGSDVLGAIVFDDDDDEEQDDDDDEGADQLSVSSIGSSLSSVLKTKGKSLQSTSLSGGNKPDLRNDKPDKKNDNTGKTMDEPNLGVSLGAHRVGSCSGIIMLPKNTIWRIYFTVSRRPQSRKKKRKPHPQPHSSASSISKSLASGSKSISNANANDGGGSVDGNGNIIDTNASTTRVGVDANDGFDPTDSCIVHLGPSLESMQLIGVYNNVANPVSGAVVYDVKFLVRSDRLAFRFEFLSSSSDPSKHLVVSAGQYEKYEMKGLEFVNDPSTGRQRVLSSFVKMLRIEESQGKLRIAKLLEELIRAEESKELDWNSNVILGFPQSYSRDYFLRILRAEIILEQKVAEQIIAKSLAAQDPDDTNKQLALLMSEENAKRLKASKDEYLVRKRKLELPKIRRAYKDIGRKLDMYDKQAAVWRHVFVVNVVIRWIENGIIAKILHVLQEFDDYGTKIGDLFQYDFTDVKYFDSPAHISDDGAIQRHRENVKTQQALSDLDGKLNDAVSKAKVEFDDFEKTLEHELHESKSKKLLELDERIDQEAEVQLLSKANKKTLKIMTSHALEEISCAIIVPDPTMKPKDQALRIAKERFINQYKQNAKLQVEYQNVVEEDETKRKINSKKRELDAFEADMQRRTDADRKRIKQALHEQLLKEREVLLKRVKFDSEVFKAVIPKVDVCEHAKTKAWGDNYATGVRCLQCGKELDSLYKEESQVLGYGSGADPALYEAVIKHRRDEATYKFKNSAELKRVEDERLRLEKERRELELGEHYFYDFTNIQAIYEFDYRHAAELKAFGIFRQGLHWTEPELEDFSKKVKIREAIRLRNQGLLPPPDESLDPINRMPDPAPTFRAIDGRHKAQNDELIHVMGRMHNFKKRIAQLKDRRVDLLVERGVFCEVLKTLHQNAFKLEVDVARLEKDLDNTGKLTFAYQRAQMLLANTRELLNLADKRKKKAEMRTVGPWERYREVQKEFDIAHDETRTLLKYKFTYDLELSVLTELVKHKELELSISKHKFEQQEVITSKMFYTRPGNMVLTRFGLCIIRMYRPVGDIIMVNLNFGQPRAKAWIHVPEVIARDKARQQAEAYLMAAEDELTHAFIAEEKRLIRKELTLMRREEIGVKEYYAVLDFAKDEENAVSKNVNTAVSDGYTVMSTKQFRALHKAWSKDEVVQRVKKHNDSIANFVGRRADKPKPLTFMSMQRLRRDVNKSLKCKFLEDLAMKAERKTREELRIGKDRLVEKLVSTLLMESVLTDMIDELAVEAVKEGLVAKRNAEFTSGIYFPSPLWMQYGAYCRLRDVWKIRKLELKTNIEMSLSANQRLEHKKDKKEPTEEDIAEELNRKMKRHIEKRRQRELNQEMSREEELSRKFYQWELKENLRERRRMREEDQMAKQYQKELELLRKMQTSKYAVSHFMLEEQEQLAGVSTFERRRMELKALTLERRHMAEEISLMIEEDKRSFELRIIDRAERQRKALLAELGDLYLEDDDESSVTPIQADTRQVKIPPWLTVPKNWHDLSIDSQIRYILMMEKWRSHTIKKETGILRDQKRVEAMQKRSLEAWQLLYDNECHKLWKAELAYMESSEESKIAEQDLHELKENITRLVIYCQDKGEVELRIKTKLRKKEAIAKQCDKELQDATRWLAVCTEKVNDRTKLLKVMEKNCRYLDTDSINGYQQRYRTDVLRDMLYKFFFTKMVYTVVNRAEIVATERKMMRLQDALAFNRINLINKTKSLRELWREFRRSEFLRMRKSALSEVHRLFPNTRRNILRACFSSLVRFHLWNRGHREAFELKYEVIKRHVDLERMFKEQLVTEKEKQASTEKGHMLTMQKHRERPVCCSNCKLFYLEAQNHSMICRYHSGKYSMECPRTCQNPGLTPLCVSHRRRRWTCCDSSQQRAEGCSRRYHIPADADPVYDKIMEKINERDATMISTLDMELKALQKDHTDDWVKVRNETMRSQVIPIEDSLAELRVTVNKYHNLKFV